MILGPSATQNYNPVPIKTRQRGIAGLIDAHPVRAFVGLSAIYFVVVLVQSSVKLLWIDELITLHLARLNSIHDLWHALALGADPNPPITYILVHWSRKILGDHEIAYRLPDAFGYWIGLISLFVFLKQRLRGSWAVFGCLVSMDMAAFDYSFESRSYAIVYGLSMLAFLCWTVAVDRARSPFVRWAGLAGMTLALAAGISTNYFAVLAFLPIAVAEVVRTFVRIRERVVSGFSGVGTSKDYYQHRFLGAIDLPVWLALIIGATPLLLYKSLIAHSIAEFAPYAWNRVSIDQVFESYTEMVEVILYPILALLAIGALIFYLKPRFRCLCETCRSRLLPRWAAAILAPQRDQARPRPYETAAVLTFAAYPICGYIIASIRGGMLSPRFVIPVCFGFAIAAAAIAHYIFSNLRYGATFLLCISCAWFVSREAVIGYSYEQQKASFYRIVNGLEAAERGMPSDLPIAIPDPLLALTFRHYAPLDLAARVVFPVDFPAIRYFRKDDSPEENLWAGRHFLYAMPVIPMADFQGSVGRYLIIASHDNWMLEDLRAHRYGFVRLSGDPRAEDIGGFTPLAHGLPKFYEAQGDRSAEPQLFVSRTPVPFQRSSDVPEEKWYAPPELLDDKEK